MAATWYWRAALGSSGVQDLPRIGPDRERERRDVEQRSMPWLSQRSPSFVLHRLRTTTAVVCDALHTDTADEHNRRMRARFTLFVDDKDGFDPLRLALAHFVTGSAPRLAEVDGRLRLSDGWDRLALPRLPAPATVGEPAEQVRVTSRAEFAAAVLGLFEDQVTWRRAGSGVLCLFSEWLTEEHLGAAGGAVVLGSPRLPAHPKGDGSQPDGPAPASRVPRVVLATIVVLAICCLALVALLLR